MTVSEIRTPLPGGWTLERGFLCNRANDWDIPLEYLLQPDHDGEAYLFPVEISDKSWVDRTSIVEVWLRALAAGNVGKPEAGMLTETIDRVAKRGGWSR